jgi:formamidopyrimidine-DNA glycosylase
MPELPEVEVVRQGLEKKILKKKIQKVEIDSGPTAKSKPRQIKNALEGSYFNGIKRVGKLLVFVLAEKNNFLLIHLKMTGQLVYCDKDNCFFGGHSLGEDQKIPGVGDELPDKHTRAIIYFQDKSRLYFNDLRKFGYMKVVSAQEYEKIFSSYGIDPLYPNFNYDNFVKSLKGKTTDIKKVLLDQSNIAGIGNIYADEILFASGVRPDRKTDTLTEKEKKDIFKNIKKIIDKAIKYKGTTFRNFIDADGQEGNFSHLLKVYGRKGEKCLKCGGAVEKTKIAGRGTFFCPTCQK